MWNKKERARIDSLIERIGGSRGLKGKTGRGSREKREYVLLLSCSSGAHEARPVLILRNWDNFEQLVEEKFNNMLYKLGSSK